MAIRSGVILMFLLLSVLLDPAGKGPDPDHTEHEHDDSDGPVDGVAAFRNADVESADSVDPDDGQDGQATSPDGPALGPALGPERPDRQHDASDCDDHDPAERGADQAVVADQVCQPRPCCG